MSHTLRNYLLLAKPGLVLGNLVSAAGGFFLASHGHGESAALLASMLGISLVVASGCVCNNCIDRNLDRKMSRTRSRPLARRAVTLPAALLYAALLGLTGTALLATAANRLAVLIVVIGFIIYVVVYSLYLKRRSVYGALIGSLAGAAPPLAGYCAASNRFDTGALILLTIFTLWQMPHCYAFAIYRRDDYAAAAIPVLPVRLGMATAKRHIFGYTLAFVAATLLPTLTGYTGTTYLAAAAGLGTGWLGMAWWGYRTSNDRLWGRNLFVFSIVAIFALSALMAIDCTGPATSDAIRTHFFRLTLF